LLLLGGGADIRRGYEGDGRGGVEEMGSGETGVTKDCAVEMVERACITELFGRPA